jgi:hypothetical protein
MGHACDQFRQRAASATVDPSFAPFSRRYGCNLGPIALGAFLALSAGTGTPVGSMLSGGSHLETGGISTCICDSERWAF